MKIDNNTYRVIFGLALTSAIVLGSQCFFAFLDLRYLASLQIAKDNTITITIQEGLVLLSAIQSLMAFIAFLYASRFWDELQRLER